MRLFVFIITIAAFMLSSCTNQPGKMNLVYIGTYTENEGPVNKKAEGIYIYEFDTVTGKLHYVSTSPETINPSFIGIDQKGSYLYAVNETGGDEPEATGHISAFALSGNGRSLEFINQVPSMGTYPCYVKVDNTNKYVMVANYGSGTIALFPVKADGRLEEASSFIRHEGKGPLSQQENAHAHMIVVSPDNCFAYACDLGTDHIYVYRFDSENGLLIDTQQHYSTHPGAGPRHLVFHPYMNIAYVVNELNGTIECMRRDSVTGTLSRFQIITTVNDGSGNEASCADIHITPSGKFLYASNRGHFNNIAMYIVDQQTGELTVNGHQPVKGKTPRNFCIDPTGTFLLVANQNSDNVVTFRIDTKTGKLLDTEIETAVPTPVCLKFYPR